MESKEDLIEWLYGLSVHGIKFGLKNITELLRRTGDPQGSFRKIHVAGTDGKGSTSAMIASILEHSGVRTGLYTSPHITDFNERVVVSGERITDDELRIMVKVIRPIVEAMGKEGMMCTFFEVVTAIAFLHFKEKEVEYAVVEVGMGGRFDATNTIVPDISVITNISMEHTEYLGDTIEKIAGEKAGIIKPGVPVVTANEGASLGVIESVALEKGSDVFSVGRPQGIVLFEDRTEFEYADKKYTVGLPGGYQAVNAATAIEVVSHLPDRDRYVRNIDKGLSDVRWPCRMQKMEGRPLIVDVTHTKAGSIVLAENISRIYGKVTVVIGVLGDKDIDGIAKNIASIASVAIVTEPVSDRALSAERTAEYMKKYVDDVRICPDVNEAFDLACRVRGEGNILVTGSFIMAEDLIKWLKRTSAGY